MLRTLECDSPRTVCDSSALADVRSVKCFSVSPDGHQSQEKGSDSALSLM